MSKRSFRTIMIMTIVFVLVLTTISLAGNSKTTEGSSINPAGNQAGSNNGNAWWKNSTTCNDALLAVDAENLSLLAKIAELNSEIAKLKADLPAEADEVLVAEPRKFAVYKTASDHPNTKNAYGIYTNFFIPENEEAQNLIAGMDSGLYEVEVQVTDPEGYVVVIEATFQAERKPRNYYDNYVELVIQ